MLYMFPILHLPNDLVLKKLLFFCSVYITSEELEKCGSEYEPYIFMRANKEARNVLQVSEIQAVSLTPQLRQKTSVSL